jgi:hypothetical protein
VQSKSQVYPWKDSVAMILATFVILKKKKKSRVQGNLQVLTYRLDWQFSKDKKELIG